MKREVIPTSPQYSNLNEKPGSGYVGRSVVAFVLLGVLTGGLAGFTASVFLLAKFDIQSQQIVIDTSGTSNSTAQVVASVSPTMRERIISIIGADGKLIAQGVIATTDGWIVTPHLIAEGEKVINSKRQAVVVERSVQDPLTGLYFLKVNQTGLPVVTWSNPDEISLGLGGLIMQLSPVAADQVTGLNILNLRPSASLEQSVLHLTDTYTIGHVDQVVEGTPFVAENSRLIGLVKTDGKVIPGPLIERRLSYFIDHQDFQLLPADITTRSLFFDATEGKTGFLVTYSGVEALQVDDVITSVDGVDLTKQDELWSVLLEKEPGSVVILDVERQGQVIQVNLAL